MDYNKLNLRNNTQENPKILERFHQFKSFGIFSSKHLYSSKFCKNLKYYLCNVSDLSNNDNIINKNTQNENQTQSHRKSETLENVHHIKRKQDNKIFYEVDKIYDKIYSKTKNNNTISNINIINKSKTNNFLNNVIPQKEKKDIKKTIMRDSHSQTQIRTLNRFDNAEKKITFNFGDFPNIQINYKHPQLYTLNNKHRINKKSYSKSILSNTIIRRQLLIKKRFNFAELIPDFASNNDYNNRERLYKYYIHKKMEYKKFN